MEARKMGRGRTDEAGFTLVEVIVIVAVIAIVAGIVVPMIFKQIDEAKITRAEADGKSISSAIQAFRKDIGVWPDLLNSGGACAPGIGVLRGTGAIPQGLADKGYNDASIMNVIDVLGTDSQSCYNASKYKGPYLPRVEPDPWGNAYVINAGNFQTDGIPTFILSAGPDGIVNTAVDSTIAEGDDIYVRVK